MLPGPSSLHGLGLHETKGRSIVAAPTEALVDSGKTWQPESQQAKVERWLRQFGFDYNPFAATDSERDYQLNEYFVEYDDFEKTIGLNHRLIFARPGDGKTAVRLRLQSFYRDSLDHRVFAFSYLIPQEIAAAPPPSIEGHLPELLTAAVRHAFVFLALRGLELPLFQDPASKQTGSEEATISKQVAAAEFATFFDKYYGLDWRLDLHQAIHDYSLLQVLENLAPVYDDLESLAVVSNSINTEWIERWLALLTSWPLPQPASFSATLFDEWSRFCWLLQQVGIQNILILVDNVDVKPIKQQRRHHTSYQTEANLSPAERMSAIVTPLLETISQQENSSNIFWKLFMPLELYLPLIRVLPTQIECAIIEWDHKQLLQLIVARVIAASNGAVTSLDQLLANDAPTNIGAYLCVASDFSPRYLLHNINKIFAAYVADAANSRLPGKLSRSSLAGIQYVAHHQALPIVPP